MPTDPTPTTPADHGPLTAVIAEYLQAVDAGERPNREALLERHPHLAEPLRDFFAAQDSVDRLAAPLRGSSGPAEKLPAGGTPPSHPMTTDGGGTTGALVPPSAASFGDYELLGEIARGGMGVVFKARQKSANRLVALKRIKSGELADEAEVRRFHAEAEAAANLDHPNIVPIYEVGEHSGQHYFSMKLVDGGGLHRRLNEYADDPPAAVRLLAAVARAVHHAHRRGILHRDLKPSNILLDDHGQPHVTDFGLAKKIEGDAGLTQSGAIVGTPEYMAPEQATARKDLTVAADLWALGAILYALLTGRPPFHGENVLETLRQVVEAKPEPPRALNAKVDSDLEVMCLKCLRKEPEGRYPSADALADDLERWLRGEPIAARPPGRGERLAKWARRNPVVAGLIAATVAVAVTGAGAFAWQFRQAVQARHTAEQREGDARTEAANARAAEGRERDERVLKEKALGEAEASAENTRAVLYVTRCNLAVAALRAGDHAQAEHLLELMKPEPGRRDLRAFEWYFLDRLLRGNRSVVRLEGVDEGGPLIHFTDDRRWALRQEQGALRVWDTATGKVARVVPLEAGATYWCLGCFDGSHRWAQVGVRAPGKEPLIRILLFDPATGKTKPLSPPRIPWVVSKSQVAFDPSDRRAAAMVLPGPRAFVWNTSTGEVISELRVTVDAGQPVPLVEWTEDGGLVRLSTGSLFDPVTGQPRFPELASYGRLAFSRDGRRFAYYSRQDKRLEVCDTLTGRPVAGLPLEDAAQLPAGRGEFALGEDGEWLLLGNQVLDLGGHHPPRKIHGLKWTEDSPGETKTRFTAIGSPLGGGQRYIAEPPPLVLPGGTVVAADRRGAVTTHRPDSGYHRLPPKVDDEDMVLIFACVAGHSYVYSSGKFPMTPFRGKLWGRKLTRASSFGTCAPGSGGRLRSSKAMARSAAHRKRAATAGVLSRS
jgi:tRNA A-37 threonylcarbamoyl transferase component Bud32